MDQPNTKAALDAGIALADIKPRLTTIEHPSGVQIPVGLVPPGFSLVLLRDALAIGDERAETPRRLVGCATLDELDSFVAHANRFKDERSVVFADAEGVKLTAVYDYHNGHADPRWCGHSAVYSCPLSDEWKLWIGGHEKGMTQDAFGQLIEDRFEDLVAADGDFAAPAAVLEMARNLAVRAKGTFERKVNVTTGEVAFVCKDEHETASTKIPRAFLLGIPVFQAGARYKVEARVRFSLRDNRPAFAYSLHRSADILRDAFGEVRAKVHTETGLPVLAGALEKSAG